MTELLLIIDFGSQYTQLIARRVRELGVYCEIVPYNHAVDYVSEIKSNNAVSGKYQLKAIIFSGGPASTHHEGSPQAADELLEMGVPILGICYGMQLICQHFGGKVIEAEQREFGRAYLKKVVEVQPKDKKTVDTKNVPQKKESDNTKENNKEDDENKPKANPLMKGFWGEDKNNKDSKKDDAYKENHQQVWMSHGDKVINLPEGFKVVAITDNSPFAVIADEKRNIYGLQFHPEVSHTTNGKQILRNFLFDIAKYSGDWSMTSFKEQAIAKIKAQVGDGRVVCAVSGGVDSTVVASLLYEAIGERLLCIFVDTGLLRYDEATQVKDAFRNNLKIPLIAVDASELFLQKLANVVDPETKRKIIGNLFIDIFEYESKKSGDADFLAQGTLYPDVIESVSFFGGPSVTIKSHHNVGGLPDRMNLKLVEPLRELFKDEVRELGKELGIPSEMLERHPFPGPGLAIRIPGEITRDKIKILQQADRIYLEEIKEAGIYKEIWQAFCVLLPVKTVGVMGDSRTYEFVCALRAVTSNDGMTADFYHFRHDFLSKVSNRIINEVRGINRIVYDITSKPPGTIEWE